jgi:hypothetical protein
MPGSVAEAQKKLHQLRVVDGADGEPAGGATVRLRSGGQITAVWCQAHHPWVSWMDPSGLTRTVHSDLVGEIVWD